MANTHEICFVFIGGTHQIYHLAPIAAQIARSSSRFTVRCICADEEAEKALREIAGQMQAKTMEIARIGIPWIARLAVRATGRPSAAKGPILASIRWHARRSCAIVTPERTSAALRKMGWRRPLIHFRHGAGDRAPASEKRLRAFDLIVVPGEKDFQRALEQGIDRSRLRVGGYVKLDYLRIAPPAKESLFGNSLPTVVYNPHFDARISSLDIALDVIERFRQQDRYNLVFAPHIRSMETMSQADRQRFLSQAVANRIIIDLGSPSLFNMRYTQAADIYLGDVSSQLYEFLSRPRPAVFLNSHGIHWEPDLRYAGWHLGEVTDGPGTVLAAIDRAVANHHNKIEAQVSALKFAFGNFDGAIERSADILIKAVTA
ncbi:hypothetical protein [Novosphingobium beihaiensis]|uniref:CDP-glycerol glycerophosphotransferase (TagB/SpsB family) n=1 Tax=Novosphingobium beihaiensis TaxID=2930389 RepID=A0ABT0BQT3_9SPHN|nr:hypothetical protein [Novosphingobium beihaiensis]MCJ2187419.1 hypothetical protein [Novosphingobium beihaiensis]